MPDAGFLEEYPLYRRFPAKLPERCHSLPKPPIHMFCLQCNSEQTFKMVNEYYDRTGNQMQEVAGLCCRAIYLCAACGTCERHFMLTFSSNKDFVLKTGQYPAWDISTDKNIADLLGEHVDHYRKALVCESQNYGIGAVAYYRRIVEDIIDTLLDSIAAILPASEADKYKEALVETKKTIVTQDKIALVKDMLPEILRPNGINPLSVLHQSLSEGLHSKTEDECSEIASTIKEAIVFLVNQVLSAKQQSKKFTDGMKRLLEKKSKPQTT